MRGLSKLLTASAVALALALPMQSANAWWGPWGWGPWDGWGGFDFHIGGGGWGNAYPGYWGGYPGYWGGYPGYWGGYPAYWGGYPGWGYPPAVVVATAPASKSADK